MTKMDYDHFHRFTSMVIEHLTPKSAEEKNKAIEFSFDINGLEFAVRSWAPSNYRQIWAKFPRGIFLEYAANEFYKDRICGEWVETANHDSAWRDALRFVEETNYNRYPMELKEIRLGTLREYKQVGHNLFQVETEVGDHLLPLDDEIWDVVDMEKYELYVCMFKRMMKHGDELDISFEREIDVHGKRRTRRLRVLDENHLQHHPYPRDRIRIKSAPFDAAGMNKLLGKGEWTLNSIYLRREGVHFL